MPRPTLSERYVVAPTGPGRPAALAFRSFDKEWGGCYPIAGVGASCGTGYPMLRLATPMERLPDLA